MVVYLTRTIENTEAAIEQIEKLYDEWLGGYNSDIRSQIYVRYDYFVINQFQNYPDPLRQKVGNRLP